jgi:cytochrome c biogenesis protein CcmG/thiol:disulfide interchange protein DsbE
MKAWKIAVAVGLVVVVGLFWRGLYMNPRFIPSVLENTRAPSFTAADLFTGQPVSLDQFRGKVVILNFWASWCAECRHEHENLLRLKNAFGANPDFVMLGVVYQDQPEDARRFLRQLGSNYPHLLDLKGEIGIDYGVYGVPETFLIDRGGVIRCKQFGPLIGDQLDKVANRWLTPMLNGKEIASCD